MALAFGAIGTDGLVYRPYVVKKISNFDGTNTVELQPQLMRDLRQGDSATGVTIDPATFEVVKEGLRQVYQGPRGTAQIFRLPGIESAGKTGTAQLFQLTADTVFARCEARKLKQRHHGWLVAYAPADNPKIVVSVLAEHSCHGNLGAGPIVKDTMMAFFKKYHPELIKEKDVSVKVVQPVTGDE
jgi:penicillin-binding protein 2